MYIKTKDIYMFFISVFVAYGVFISFSTAFLSKNINLSYKTLLFAIPLFLIYSRALFRKENYRYTFFCVLVVASLMASALINRGILTHTFFTSLTVVLKIIILTLFIEVSKTEGYLERNFRVVFWVLFFFCALSDFVSIIMPHRYYTEWGGVVTDTLLGSKFSVSYRHFWLAVLFPCLFEEKKKLRFLFYIWTFAIAAYTECTTMVIGILLYMILDVFRNKTDKVLCNKFFLIIAVVISDTILLLSNWVLMIPAVQSLIVDVLHEDMTLSGRMNIYTRLDTLRYVNPVWGVSLDANYTFSFLNTGAANYQNGILDLYVSQGLLGVCLAIGGLLYLIHIYKTKESKYFLYLIYIYIFLSSVEITFRPDIFMLTLMGMLFSEFKDNKVLQEEYQ